MEVYRAPDQREQLSQTSVLRNRDRVEMLKLSKLLNQALCFGNILILVRDWGRQVESCGGRVPH